MFLFSSIPDTSVFNDPSLLLRSSRATQIAPNYCVSFFLIPSLTVGNLDLAMRVQQSWRQHPAKQAITLSQGRLVKPLQQPFIHVVHASWHPVGVCGAGRKSPRDITSILTSQKDYRTTGDSLVPATDSVLSSTWKEDQDLLGKEIENMKVYYSINPQGGCILISAGSCVPPLPIPFPLYLECRTNERQSEVMDCSV